jgi:hypothetical protein
MKNMQVCKIGKEQFESPRRLGRPQKAQSARPSSDAESRQSPRRVVCGGISPIIDNLLPWASDVTGNEQNQEAALMPNVGLVFTVGGPLVYESAERRSISINEVDFGHAFVVDRGHTAEQAPT